MGKLIIHANPNPEKQEVERAAVYKSLPFEEKLKQLFALIDLSVKMNAGMPIKKPQGKGLVIRKLKS